jgi:NTP pyrophosphatase (non-canonical NTP hydrolase)
MKLTLNIFERKILEKAINTYGVKNQEDVAIEEMAELTKAIIKNRRYNSDATKENIAEEIADVIVMLAQLLFVYGVTKHSDVSDYIDGKIQRLANRLNEGEDNE